MKKYHLVNIISFNAKQINIFTLFIVSGEKKYCDFFFLLWSCIVEKFVVESMQYAEVANTKR